MSKYQGRNMNLTCKSGCTIGTPLRSCPVHGEPSLIDEVIAKKKVLRHTTHPRKRKPQQRSLEDRAWLRWNRFVCFFSPTERRAVIALVHGWTQKEQP